MKTSESDHNLEKRQRRKRQQKGKWHEHDGR